MTVCCVWSLPTLKSVLQTADHPLWPLLDRKIHQNPPWPRPPLKVLNTTGQWFACTLSCFHYSSAKKVVVKHTSRLRKPLDRPRNLDFFRGYNVTWHAPAPPGYLRSCAFFALEKKKHSQPFGLVCSWKIILIIVVAKCFLMLQYCFVDSMEYVTSLKIVWGSVFVVKWIKVV